MTDLLISMIASQLKIPPSVIVELKTANPRLLAARFDHNAQPATATLKIEVQSAQGAHTLTMTLPVDLLRRVGPVYEKAVKLAAN